MDGKLSNIQQREEEFLIGREQELHSYNQFLLGKGQKFIWSMHGTGGMGKTTLLDAFRRRSLREGASFILIDSREFVHTPEQLCRHFLRLMNGAADTLHIHDPSKGILDQICELSNSGCVTLAFDNYEEMIDLDGWLRENILQWLPRNVLTILAGRKPLQGVWILSPAWRERVQQISLRGLSEEQSNEYLAKCGVLDAPVQKKIWEKTKGHPLALSLAAATWSESMSEAEDEEWFSLLVEQWLREVPNEDFREWVEVVSVLRYFDRESISFVNGGEDITAEEFSSLCKLSFVRKTGKGWTLHDVMREALSKLIMEHTPNKYRELLARCAELQVNRIMQSPRDGSTTWHVRECFAYIGDASIRWLVTPTEQEQYVWEELSLCNLADGEHYMERRYEQEAARQGSETHSLDVIKAKDLSLKELVSLNNNIVKLLRNQAGEAVGLSVIFPINISTIPYMNKDPLASVYINSLSSKEYKEFLVPASSQAGWYIRIIDVLEPMNPLMSMQAMALIFSMMVTGGIIAASPPPNPILLQSHRSLGFQEIPNTYHTYYDGVTPTPTFFLDTRGEKLRTLFEDLLRRTGLRTKEDSDSLADKSQADKIQKMMQGLTEREQEVIQHVIQGLSNIEIGKALYITEATVKKHLRSAYKKLQVQNRADLLRRLL